MNKPADVELILSPSWIIPVVPRDRVYEDCSLVIDSGKIVEICPSGELDSRYRAKQHIILNGKALMPGLINAHGHLAMSLLRGYADDKPLMTWLEQHIWPAEQRWVDEEFVSDGAQLAIAEMLSSGTTCFSDMYFFPEATARAAFDSGIRAHVYFPILDFPTAWAKDSDEYLSKGLSLHDDYRTHELVTIGFGPHAPYTVSDAPLKKIATYAEELQAPVQIHLHETAFEVESALESTQKRPSQRLADLGLLSPLTQCVHMTQVTDEDIDILKNSGAHVVHCPESNLKLASGLCPVQKLLDNNINVCLGTDGAASNNDLDMFGELKTAALIGKICDGDASAVGAMTALELATINGAKALGIEDKIGSLEAGKQADVIAIDLSAIQHTPMHNPISQIAYTHVGDKVSDVWVKGRQLKSDGKLTALNTEALQEKAKHWKDKLSQTTL